MTITTCFGLSSGHHQDFTNFLLQESIQYAHLRFDVRDLIILVISKLCK